MLRLLSYNIRHGGAGREAALAEVIRAAAPDIVVLQEASRPAIVSALAKACDLEICGAVPRFSLGFLSRVPMEEARWLRPRVSRHAFLELQPRGLPLTIFGVHLAAVHAAWTERRRTFEFRALLRSIERHQHGFHVLAGDFNTLAPGEALDVSRLPARLRALVWLSGGTIRWRTIARVLEAGYVDAFRELHVDGPGFTFPARDPHVRLDYLFVPKAFQARVVSCDVVNSGAVARASDHCPLLSVIETGASSSPL
jgi:exodeoxyribonuclease-3